jgi:hypothetical protein
MKFVSIDVSTKFLAYTLWQDGKILKTGKIFPSTAGDEGVGSLGHAVAKEFSRHKDIDAVVYEAAFMGNNVMVVKGLSKTTGAFITGFYSIGVRNFKAVPPITWQTHIGTGRTSPADLAALRNTYKGKSASWIKSKDRENRKQKIIDYVNKRFNKRLKMEDNDIADSIGLGCYAMDHWPELGSVK